ncbi:MAG: 2,3-bisphosphoglycerate-dependent phosphoglycerate mutase [Bacilli bacterium]
MYNLSEWNLENKFTGCTDVDLSETGKKETAEKFGKEQVLIWRRSYDVKPPLLNEDDTRNPAKLAQYRNINKDELPLGESLLNTVNRVVPYFENIIKLDMLNNKKVLIVAHGNSLRALVMHLENLSPDIIIKVNIPTGVPLVYEFDDQFKVAKKYYLGDQGLIASKINKVVNQGKQ